MSKWLINYLNELYANQCDKFADLILRKKEAKRRTKVEDELEQDTRIN